MFNRKVTKKKILADARYKKLTKKDLKCTTCQRMLYDIHADIRAITCEYCVQKLIEPPKQPPVPLNNIGYPRGWHLKSRYVAPDGTLYKRGRKIDASSKEVVNKTKSSNQTTNRRLKRATKSKSAVNKRRR